MVLIISTPILIFNIISGLVYFPGYYMNRYDALEFNSTAKLYSLADLMATWCSAFIFAFIAYAMNILETGKILLKLSIHTTFYQQPEFQW